MINDKLSSLGPPRGGRIVRDPGEVIKEIEEYETRKSLEGEILEIPASADYCTVTNQSKPDDSLRFKVGGIESATDYFELKDLEVPEGSWKSLKLVISPAYGDSEYETWRFWENRSRANQRVPSQVVQGIYENGVLCPFRVFYWFLRSAYEMKSVNEENSTRFLEFIKTLHPKTDLQDDFGVSWHFAEAYIPFKGNIIVETRGMDKSHPLHQEFALEAHIPLTGQGLEEYCNNALGDTYAHFLEVFRWYAPDQINNSTTLTLTTTQNGQKCTTLRFLSDGVHLNLHSVIEQTLPAHFVIADPMDFTPHEAGP